MTVHARPDSHFVITRFGLGVTDENWYEYRLDLFEAVTHASLSAQTSQDFHWLLIVDALIPDGARDRLQALMAERSNFHIVPLDPTAHRWMTLGTLNWLWHGAQDHVLAEGLIDDVGDYVITSIIDDDDAWHTRTVESVNRLLFGQFLAKLDHPNRISSRFAGLLVSQGAGAAMTFPKGMQWNIIDDQHSLARYPWHSMSAFMVSRFSSGVAVTSARHDTVGKFATVPAFHVAEVDTPHPMWLYVRHPDAMSLQSQADAYGPAVHTSRSVLHADLADAFGIDLDALARYRKTWANRHEESAEHSNVLGPHRRLDMQYRITALNRQIDALDRRLAGADAQEREELVRRRGAADAERHQAITLFRRFAG